jgi:sugar (pentulose or hexulose) kinase
MIILVIDCGASYIKGALVDYSTGKIKEKYYKKTLYDSGNMELSRLSQVMNAVTEIIITMSKKGDDLHIAIANEMHGFVVADNNGKGCFDYISWQDEFFPDDCSPSEYLKSIRKKLTEKDILATGMPVKLGLPSVNLYYLMNKKPGDGNSSEIYFYTLGDYIIRAISNQQPYIHPTNAAATGLYNIIDNEWNGNIIHKLKLEGIYFPKISNNSLIECDFYGRHLIIYSAIGDQQAALFGAGLLNESDISVNMGTGAQVSILCKNPEISSQYQIRPYFNNYFLKTIPHIPSGRALNVYYRFIKDIVVSFNHEVDDKKIWDFIITRAVESQLESLVIDLSFFSNPITEKITGTIDEIREKEFFAGNLFRSAFRQMSRNVYDIAARLADLNKITRIIFSGGTIGKNRLLQEFILECFGNIHEYQVEADETFKGLTNYIFNNISESERA